MSNSETQQALAFTAEVRLRSAATQHLALCKKFGPEGFKLDLPQDAVQEIINLLDRAGRMDAENKVLKSRLEIDPSQPIDGIEARDETIRLLDGQVLALRADAERYRWLRDFHNGPGGVFSGLPYISAGDGNDSAWALTGVTADAGIDAARVGHTTNDAQQPSLWSEESTLQNSD